MAQRRGVLGRWKGGAVLMTWLINFYLDHTGKRWKEMQEYTIRVQLHADQVIGQLPERVPHGE
jgi:hypothetical protein